MSTSGGRTTSDGGTGADLRLTGSRSQRSPGVVGKMSPLVLGDRRGVEGREGVKTEGSRRGTGSFDSDV